MVSASHPYHSRPGIDHEPELFRPLNKPLPPTLNDSIPCFDEALGVLLQIRYSKGDCPTNITLDFKSATLRGVFPTLCATDNIGTEESHDLGLGTATED